MLQTFDLTKLRKCCSNVRVFIILLQICFHVSFAQSAQPPKLLIISFGGMRWDYLEDLDHLPNFKFIKSIGSFSDYVTNTFVSESLPNQWSLVTGLNQDSHGMIQNEMFDREMNRKFSLKSQKLSTEAEPIEWFRGNSAAIEPIWITNQKADKTRNSLVQWAGGEYKWDKKAPILIDNHQMSDYSKFAKRIVQLMTRENDPVNFGAFYLDKLDKIGHEFGPFSKEIKNELNALDTELVGNLIKQLKSHHIFEETNIILTSDHGMAKVSSKNAKILENYVDVNLFNFFGGPVVVNLFLKNYDDFDKVYESLKPIKHISLYKSDEIPKELNFRDHQRNGDLVLIADDGYTIHLTKKGSSIKGANGYDGTKTSSMHSIFIAEGPAFRKNYNLDNFRNVDIYPLMCQVLSLEPLPNNGTFDNVKSMLNSELLKRNLNFYILLSMVPVTLSMLAAFVLCIMTNRSKSTKNIIRMDNGDGYKMLSMREDELEFDSDSEAVSESDVFSAALL